MFKRCTVLAVVAFGFTAGLPATAQAPAVVNVATTPTDSGAAVYYADELGLFKKAGLDVHVEALASGAAVAAGVASGTIDIAQGSLPSLAAAHEKRIPFVLIAPGALYSDKAPTSALVVSKTSTFKTAKDLNGKTLANNALKNIGEIAADAWLDKGGADVSSVHVIEMPLGEMESALGQGRIDSAILVEPSLGKALTGNVKILAPAYSAIAKEFMINAWFTTNRGPRRIPTFSSASIRRCAKRAAGRTSRQIVRSRRRFSRSIRRSQWVRRIRA